MKFKTLLFDVRDSVARITLNRPEAVNTINVEMSKELMHVAMQCDEDSLIRAVLITGAGSIFCGGGDVKGFASQGENLPHHLKEITTHLHVAMSYLVRMNPPVVAAVHGSAAGAGLSLACACDMVLAAESAKFTLAYTGIGLTPDGGATYTLSRLVGLKRTLEMALTNRLLSAQEALDWGIVTRLVPEKDLLTEARTLADRLAAGPTKAFGATKRLLQSGLTESFESQMKHESRSIAEIARTEDGREGIAAFLEKRAPNFKGQ
ncbi:MAG: enoyl-CoA hydratase [Desulfobacteraceae bacterium]|jgi:2-(1,2-epoxy-1,2-dihydrophenyl)acetyl-CoA isomerase|nr:enoyl-CoA hydratase [Desulfobacteraceae bacterium]